jgi:hypothetical protein
MAVKTSSSIPVFSASVFWNAFIIVKMRSGVGRFAVVGVAMKLGSLVELLLVQIYTVESAWFTVQFDCSNP